MNIYTNKFTRCGDKSNDESNDIYLVVYMLILFPTNCWKYTSWTLRKSNMRYYVLYILYSLFFLSQCVYFHVHDIKQLIDVDPMVQVVAIQIYYKLIVPIHILLEWAAWQCDRSMGASHIILFILRWLKKDKSPKAISSHFLFLWCCAVHVPTSCIVVVLVI